MTRGDTIWELVRQASEALPEPFSRAALVRWISERRPDVELSSIGTHIQYAVADAPNRSAHNLGTRPPLLVRVDRGLYRRYRVNAETQQSECPARPPSPDEPAAARKPAPGSTSRIILVGCSRTKATSALPARDLFQGQGFRLARDYAVRSGLRWFVLSAKFGVLDPDDVVGPYDVYLPDQPPGYRTAWGEWVVAQLGARLRMEGVTVEVHAGEAYCSPLRGPLRRWGGGVDAPLAGLPQGKRLAWPGYRTAADGGSTQPDRPALEPLLDPSGATSPADFLAAGAAGRDVPGLYTWWVDAEGAQALSRGFGTEVRPGLLYAGKAGGHRAGGTPSEATLWGRIASNHLRGNVRASTLRKSLAALLSAAGPAPTESGLSAWMQQHLRVATLPVPSELVSALEDELVARTNPPLNLAGVESTESRSTLSRLRGLMSQRSANAATGPAEESITGATEVLGAFERRVRADLDRILASGYRPTVFQRMLNEHGAVETARRLLGSSQLSDGFRHLWEHGLLQHSVEAAVLDPAHAILFTEVELGVARNRLADAGYAVA